MTNIFDEVKMIKGDKRFTGPISMNTVEQDDVQYFRMHYVKFFEGARTFIHTHTSDQILIGCEGEGIVVFLNKKNDNGNLQEKYQQRDNEPIFMKKGDIVMIPKGVPHYHGSNNKQITFGHIAILSKNAESSWDYDCAVPLE